MLALALFLPGTAQAASPYVGIEGGLLHGRRSDMDSWVALESLQAPAAAPSALQGFTDFDDTLSVDYATGSDLGISTGYDLGRIRLELEMSRKRMRIGPIGPDENFDNLAQYLNSSLGRSPGEAGPGAAELPALGVGDFVVPGKMTLYSAMANGLVDFDIGHRLTVYGGGGVGRSWARALGDQDGAMAWQWIAGLRYALSRRVGAGFKYRYFNSGIVQLRHPPVHYPGNVDDTGEKWNATVVPEIEGEIRTRSLLFSLHFNL